MLHYKVFKVNPIEENCYILWDDVSHDGTVIDCGCWNNQEKQRVADFIKQKNINLKYILQTHMHFDHCIGLDFVCGINGLSPLCHIADLPVYEAAPDMVQKWFRIDISNLLPKAHATLTEETELYLGKEQIIVLQTPGHTPGGLCFYAPSANAVFTGDTIFRMSIGRTDLPGGNLQQILSSIKSKLFTLPPHTVVLPGHGPESKIIEELAHNPYLQL